MQEYLTHGSGTIRPLAPSQLIKQKLCYNINYIGIYEKVIDIFKKCGILKQYLF